MKLVNSLSGLNILMMLGAAMILSACSAKHAYQGIQAGHVNHCYLYPYEQAQECLQQVTLPYDEYTRKRAEVLKEKDSAPTK
ncbi:hypothetical protein [Thalassotalea litorea]|uniref:hypothetical protein n=1 Tax=Thalassotalea litorea TaxID=2020715 RepID=UPI00373533AE